MGALNAWYPGYSSVEGGIFRANPLPNRKLSVAAVPAHICNVWIALVALVKKRLVSRTTQPAGTTANPFRILFSVVKFNLAAAPVATA